MPLLLSTRLSVVAAAFSANTAEAARLARLAGFRGLVVDCYGKIDLTELSTTGQREWLRGLTQQDQKLTALQMNLGRDGLGAGTDVERQVQRIDRAMNLVVKLGAGMLAVELGQVPRARVAVAPRPTIPPALAGLIIVPESALSPPAAEILPPPDPAFVASVEFALNEVAGRADRYGVVVAFSSALSSLNSLTIALAGPACPWFGVDLDPVGLLRDGIPIDAAFSQVGDSIRHVRLRDAIVGDDHRTRPVVVGSGNVDWPAFLNALEAAGYSGMLTVDPIDLADRRAAACEAVTRLNSVAEKR